MAAFNLNEYATVAERMAQLKVEYPDYRLITEDMTTAQDRAVLTWRVKATLFLNAEDQAKGLPKATGHAFEIDGQGMANKTSALENAESSAVGRCLMLAGWAMSKKGLASREEMEKVARGNTPQRDWMGEADALALVYNLDGLRKLYSEAVASRAVPEIVEKIKSYGNDLAGSQDTAGEPSRGKGTA
jgi:hypothetical protein